MKKYYFILIVVFILFQELGFSIYSILSIVIFTNYLVQLFIKSNERIAFRELALLLFSLNYLLSPALMYSGLDEFQSYKMVIPETEYFSLALPAILLFHLGMFIFPGDLFKQDIEVLKESLKFNVIQLKQWIFLGLLLRTISSFLPSEVAFLFYLLSSIRFIGAFGLIIINPSKYKLYLSVVFVFEILYSIKGGLFHDMVIWLIFLSLLISYLFKPKLYIKLSVFILSIIFLFILQISKNDYRSKTWQGNEEAGLETFRESVKNSTENSVGLFNKVAVASSVSRVNQAWIFASTVENMKRTQDFQSFSLLLQYIEAALLPRFLAPNKLNAGSRDIFNKFSGGFIDAGTSMALGIFADGYVSFGRFGVYSFAFGFGLVFSLVFYIVNKWSKVSPFFLFFLFPILHYAIRADCETQTVLGHIVKGLFLYGLFFIYYKRFFQKTMFKSTLSLG